MKKQFILFCIALIAVAPICLGETNRKESSADKSATKETALINAEKSAWEAFKNKQADALRKYLATDYRGVYADGTKTFDAEVVDMGKIDLQDYSFADAKITFPSADVALMTYKVTMHQTFAGRDMSGTYNAASVYIKQGGKWLITFHTEIKGQ